LENATVTKLIKTFIMGLQEVPCFVEIIFEVLQKTVIR